MTLKSCVNVCSIPQLYHSTLGTWYTCLLTVITLNIMVDIDLMGAVGIVIVLGRVLSKCSRTDHQNLIPHLAEKTTLIIRKINSKWIILQVQRNTRLQIKWKIIKQGLTALAGLLLVHLVVTKRISPTGLAFNFVQWTHLMEELVNSASIYKSKI